MNRLLTFALVAATLAVAVVVVTTVPALPDRVATHFGAGGGANGFMSRDGYLWFILGFGVALPWLVYGVCAFVATGRLSMRHAEYWLAPERRAQTRTSLRGFGAAAALIVAIALAAAHLAVLDANARTPPRLDEPVFLTGLALFVVAIVGLSIVHAVRFRMPPGAASRR